MSKKYYMTVKDTDGNVIFDHKSDYASRLVALYNKDAFSADGWIRSPFLNAVIETNITDREMYRLECGDKF